MIKIPTQIQQQYDHLLTKKEVAPHFHPHYKKWLRFYLDFCSKYNHPAHSPSSLPSFIQKLTDKNQPENLRLQAQHAVHLYCSEFISNPSKLATQAHSNPLIPTPITDASHSDSNHRPVHRNRKTVVNDCMTSPTRANNRPTHYLETPRLKTQ